MNKTHFIKCAIGVIDHLFKEIGLLRNAASSLMKANDTLQVMYFEARKDAEIEKAWAEKYRLQAEALPAFQQLYAEAMELARDKTRDANNFERKLEESWTKIHRLEMELSTKPIQEAELRMERNQAQALVFELKYRLEEKHRGIGLVQSERSRLLSDKVANMEEISNLRIALENTRAELAEYSYAPEEEEVATKRDQPTFLAVLHEAGVKIGEKIPSWISG